MHVSPPAAVLLALYVAVNLTAFILFGVDKRRARRHMRRIPESTLMGVSALGGALGALLGMRVFHHKTRHRKFTIGVPLLLIFHAALAALLLYLRSSAMMPNGTLLP